MSGMMVEQSEWSTSPANVCGMSEHYDDVEVEQSHSTPIEMSRTTKRTQMVQPNPDMHDILCSEISERGPPLNQAEIVKNEPPEDDQNPPKTTNYLHTAENLAKESPAKRRNKSET